MIASAMRRTWRELSADRRTSSSHGMGRVGGCGYEAAGASQKVRRASCCDRVSVSNCLKVRTPPQANPQANAIAPMIFSLEMVMVWSTP